MAATTASPRHRPRHRSVAAGHRSPRWVCAARRRAGVPLPLLLHGRRLAAGRAGHLAARRRPHRRAHPGQLRDDQRAGGPRAVAGQLRHLHRRRDARHRGLRRAGRLRAGPAALPWPGHAVRGDAAGADRAVPAADHPDLRDDRAHLRPGRLLPRHDPAVRDQLHRGVRVPAVLPAAARRAVRRRAGSTAPSELRILWSIALPLVRPALLTASCCSRSSGRGTSSCGRSWSPRTPTCSRSR